uniref:(northern house mosquito) hypothetical protein n=1 Tax=Culex pipiens TaxID=7175 RepID=A0A8D8JDK6_CULPI
MALIPIEQIGNPPSVPPTAANPSVVINTPSSTPPARTITVPTAAALKMGVGFLLQILITQGKRDDTGRILQHPVQVLLNECGICAAPTSTFSPSAIPVICTTTSAVPIPHSRGTIKKSKLAVLRV